MATNLTDLVQAFEREVAIPGTFAVTYPNTTPTDIVGTLGDAFGEVQLDGFLGDQVLDVPTGVITPGLVPATAALLVIYAGIRLVRAEIRATTTMTRAKAGPVEYETQRSASSLVQILKDLADRRAALLQALRTGLALDSVLDSYNGRYYGPLLIPQIRPGIVEGPYPLVEVWPAGLP